MRRDRHKVEQFLNPRHGFWEQLYRAVNGEWPKSHELAKKKGEKYLSYLDDLEVEVIELRHGRSGALLSSKHIGERLGIQREVARQIHEEAIQKIRKHEQRRR